ncbi:MAG TPA: hypothetical protein VJ180_14440, partial [Pyrinomonadaceae bacterium]|nr:hypothetical protein [Pyrinomonadaceae bacterium]
PHSFCTTTCLLLLANRTDKCFALLCAHFALFAVKTEQNRKGRKVCRKDRKGKLYQYPKVGDLP